VRAFFSPIPSSGVGKRTRFGLPLPSLWHHIGRDFLLSSARYRCTLFSSPRGGVICGCPSLFPSFFLDEIAFFQRHRKAMSFFFPSPVPVNDRLLLRILSLLRDTSKVSTLLPFVPTTSFSRTSFVFSPKASLRIFSPPFPPFFRT